MSNNNDSGPPNEGGNRPRRSSVTSVTFNNLFGRSNSTSGGPPAPFPGAIASATQDQRRRMSISTLGLSGTSPTQNSPFALGGRRGSVSTAGSDSIDENAIDDDDGPSRSNPNTPFVRRMSFGAQALRTVRTSGSPGATGRQPVYTTAQEPALPSIPSGPRSSRAGSVSRGAGLNSPNDTAYQASMQSKPRTISDFASVRTGESGGFNWSDQLKSRAESSVSQNQRPSFSTSPTYTKPAPIHDRAKSVSEMAAPPTAVPAAPARKPAPRKPDAMQERILKGDFYMD